jgi:hypothetical protein
VNSVRSGVVVIRASSQGYTPVIRDTLVQRKEDDKKDVQRFNWNAVSLPEMLRPRTRRPGYEQL